MKRNSFQIESMTWTFNSTLNKQIELDYDLALAMSRIIYIDQILHIGFDESEVKSALLSDRNVTLQSPTLKGNLSINGSYYLDDETNLIAPIVSGAFVDGGVIHLYQDNICSYVSADNTNFILSC